MCLQIKYRAPPPILLVRDTKHWISNFTLALLKNAGKSGKYPTSSILKKNQGKGLRENLTI